MRVKQKNMYFGKTAFTFITVCMDYFSGLLCLYIAYWFRIYFFWLPISTDFIRINEFFVSWSGLFVFLLFLTGFYKLKIADNYKLAAMIRSITISSVFSLLFLYLIQGNLVLSRLFFGTFLVLSILLVPLLHTLVEKLLKSTGLFNENALVISREDLIDCIVKNYCENVVIPTSIVGYIDIRGKNNTRDCQYDYLGSLSDLEEIVKKNRIKCVIVHYTELSNEEFSAIISKIEVLVHQVVFFSHVSNVSTLNFTANYIPNKLRIMFFIQNNLSHKWQRICKRLIDIIFALLLSILVLPIIFVISVLIFLDSSGPIVFGHKRVGRGGREFICYKFRTMVPNAGSVLYEYLENNEKAKLEWQENYKLQNDPRITKIGGILRKTSLDELPQLWNVIKGDMSLVGPRPIIRDEIQKYGDYIEEFYLVRPGITGVWQVSGRSDTSYDERVQMDCWYIHNWSIWLDIACLLKTVEVVIRKKGAY